MSTERGTSPSKAGDGQEPQDRIHEETVTGKAFDRRLVGRLMRYAVPYRWRMALALLLILLTTALGLAGPLIVTYAIDGPLSESVSGLQTEGGFSQQALRSLLLLSGLFVLVSLALIGLRFYSTYTMARVGQDVMFDLRKELFSHLQRMPFSFYDRNPVGRLVTRITNDIEALNELFASGFVILLADVMVLVGISALLLWRNFNLALLTLSVLPCLLLVTFVFRNKARKYYREQRGHLARLGAFAQESLQGMEILQLFRREERNLNRYNGINASLMRAFKKSVLAYSVYFPVVEILGKFMLAAIIWQASRQILAGESSYGDFYLFWVCLERFFQPIRDMAERYNVLQAAMAAGERVFKVLDTPEGMPRLESANGQKPGTPGRVEFQNVWFAYQGEEFVLRDINFVVEPGKTVAIVGATGSGKSTIINLLSRFYDPQQGVIKVDGTDIRHCDKRKLRRRIGVVLQDVFLFSRSIRDNIRLGDLEISSDRVAECAHLVNADRLIDRLEHGYDQLLTERGGSLSVGEKQLLAFARALVHNPDFLILDEATAHVDTETERLIQEALERLLTNRTSIVIAHRLSTIRRADWILVLHKGKIREEGTHVDLLRQKGIYSRLHELQYPA